MSALLLGAARRNLIELRRYAFDTVFSIGGILLLFLLLFYGARGLGGPELNSGETLSSLVAGFITFGLVVQSYASISSWVTQTATLGTLEQLAMSPFGLTRVLLSEFAASLAYQVVVVTVVSTIVQAATGRWLRLDAVSLFPLVVLLLVQVLGCGLLLGGLALVFKRVVALVGLMQFIFVALIAAPIHRYPLMRLLPVAEASSMIRRVTVDGITISEINLSTWFSLGAVSVGYLTVGLFVFRGMDQLARRHGLIGVH